MQLVFNKAELVEALKLSARRFDEMRPALEALGFPRPVPGMGARWSVMAVQSWINRGAVLPASPLAGVEQGDGADAALSTPVLSMQRHLEAKYGGVRS